MKSSSQQEPEQVSDLVERIAAASQQIFNATTRSMVKKLIQDGVLPPFKTPLQDFTEQVWSD